MKYFLILIVSAIGLTYQATAEPAKKRTCRIVFPDRPNDAPKAAYLFDGKASQPVNLPSMNFSEVIGLPAGDITILMTPTAITDSENLPRDAPKLKITGDVEDFYILITADPLNTTLPLRMELVDASAGKLKPGETLWSNLTGHEIVADLGGSKMSVAPKGHTVSKDPVPSSGYYKAEFSYQAEGKGDFQTITEQNWWHDTKSRHIGFIVNTEGKLPRIYFYRDFRAP
jgi:hypothetical protein